LLPEGRDLPERQAELCVQHGGERRGLRPDLGGGRAEGIGRLLRMAPLHASCAPLTLSDVHLNGPDHDARDGQLS